MIGVSLASWALEIKNPFKAYIVCFLHVFEAVGLGRFSTLVQFRLEFHEDNL